MAVVTKDSGQRIEYVTGAKRDTEDGKPLFGIVPVQTWDVIQNIYGGTFMEVDRSQPVIIEPEGERDDTLIDDLMLRRLSTLLVRGAKKYGRWNWRKGMPLMRAFSSCIRHLMQWLAGDTSEDHLAAAVFNIMVLMRTEREIRLGRLGKDLADAGPLSPQATYKETQS